jgi:hypothetical protein
VFSAPFSLKPVRDNSSEGGMKQKERRVSGNLHYDLPVTLKGGKKKRQYRWCEDLD